MLIKFPASDFSPTYREIETKEDGELRVTLGKGSYITSGMMGTCGHVLIGNYCSIAEGIEFSIGRNHSMEYATTYPFNVISKDGKYSDPIAGPEPVGSYDHLQIVIGSDVWLGSDVTVMGGSKIGVGACVGTHALVAGDVPPYSIVGGIPARVIRYRFPEEIIKKLLTIKWWYWDIDTIHNNYESMKDVEAFCDKFYPEALARISEESSIGENLRWMRASGMKIYYTFADFGRQNPIWENVLNQFLKEFDEQSPCVLIFEVKDFLRNANGLDIIVNKLKGLGASAPQVFIHSDLTEQAIILRNMDCFITTREPESILGIDCAWEIGAKIISGFDSNLFGEHGA